MNEARIIKNKKELATSDLRRKALDIIEAGIKRVLPTTILPDCLSFDPKARTISIHNQAHQIRRRLFVIGGGKASGLMAQTLESLIGVDAIESGIVVEKADPAEFKTAKIKIVQAGHPVPDSRGVEAVKDILRLKKQYSVGKDDLVLCLISGGGSALMPSPIEGLTLDDKQSVTRFLIACGANIDEINTVRKHLSKVKGGRLGRYFAPAKVLSLILSDVVGNDLNIIASGPTFPDSSTYSEAYAALKKYDLLKQVPQNVISVLSKGCRGEIEETPKSLDNVINHIIGDNQMALGAMAEKGRQLGLNPHIITAEQVGDTETVARQRASEIMGGTFAEWDVLLIGGETTPKLPDNSGKGGRNQHYAALTPLLLEKYPGDWVFASVGTDGSDFMSGVAGAIVDNDTLNIFAQKKLDFSAMLERYDSNTLLSLAGNSLIFTGNTYTNVGDVMLYLT